LLISAHNEEKTIGKRIENALDTDVGNHQFEIVIVSDGSTDDTVKEAKKFAGKSMKLIEIKEHKGKISALNYAVKKLNSDIIVFSDANSMYKNDTIKQLVKHFGEEDVGVVCGKITVSKPKKSWLGFGESVYWNYDHILKKAENRFGGPVSAQGSVYAIRRDLYRMIPAAVTDDFFESAQVITQGKRMVFEPCAISEEEVSQKLSGEFQRRVRSTEQGWRAIFELICLLNPFRFGIYSLKLFSHKVLRRLTPFGLILLFILNAANLNNGNVYILFGAIQVIFYLLAFIAWIFPACRKKFILNIPLFFILGHIAMAKGLINALSGIKSEKWSHVRS